jgi:transcription antitermination factor NusG
MQEENKETENWYAGRVRYNTEQKIKDFLTERGITCYIPFEKKVIEREGRRKHVWRPIIPCYIFVCADYTTLLTLPQECGYSISYVRNLATRHIQEIPARQMQDFMFILDFSEHAILLDSNLKPGMKVRIIKGNFAGIEGELVRIKGHRRVVVRLEGMFALACNTYLPKEWLEAV